MISHSVCSLFFFSCLRQPQRTTLFPYTTLFRSSRQPHNVHHPNVQRAPQCEACPYVSHVLREKHRGTPHTVALFERDRKSTRLNSSHLGISYAVFCLKKKKKKKKMQTNNTI